MPCIAPDTPILVFAKAPQPGAVKTRLIPLLGEAGAADLHAALVQYALATARHAQPGDVRLYCAPDTKDAFFRHCAIAYGVSLMTQADGDLGERMRQAFQEALQDAPHVILIGSDCPTLTVQHLLQADCALRAGYDAVLSPTEDGGYGLIALRRCADDLFEGIAWSEATVMPETRARLQRLGWSWRELDTIWDVDRPADYERLHESGLLAGWFGGAQDD